MSRREAPPLSPKDVLTQYGRAAGRKCSFRDRPRASEVELSLLAGRYSVTQATVLIARRSVDSDDAVRYARVASLIQAGFEVRRTPNRRNPDHVSVKFEGLWDDAVGEKFDACFSDAVTEDV